MKTFFSQDFFEVLLNITPTHTHTHAHPLSEGFNPVFTEHICNASFCVVCVGVCGSVGVCVCVCVCVFVHYSCSWISFCNTSSTVNKCHNIKKIRFLSFIRHELVIV